MQSTPLSFDGFGYITLVPANIGFGEPQKQPQEAAAQPEVEEGDNCLQGQGAQADRAEPQKYIDNCYRKLMNSYACAALVGGEAEKKAKDNLERFYRQLHNDTTVGIEKIYKRAKQLGCNHKSSNP